MSSSSSSSRIGSKAQLPESGKAAAAERFAFATLVTSDAYVDGALVLYHSLHRTLTPYSVVCLATPSTLSAQSLERLRRHFDSVIEADLRLSDDHHNLSVLGRPDLRSTLTKIQLWDPALFGAWDALCYLDADTLVRQPIDGIFERLHAWREGTSSYRDGGLIAAAPDTGWPDCFNSGVLLLAPGYKCHSDLLQRVSKSGASFDGADQGLLNEHFSDWAASAPYRRLPFLYNTTANVYYTYEPAVQRFGHDVHVVHFIGVSKPWHWNRTPGGSLGSDDSASERWRQLASLWWDIHDEHVSGWRYWKGPFEKQVAFGKGYHHITKPPAAFVAQMAAAAGHSQEHSQEHRHDQQMQEGPCTAASAAEQNVPAYEVDEVPDWYKDWSWAEDRAHPFDYSYLSSHTSTHRHEVQGQHQPSQPIQDSDPGLKEPHQDATNCTLHCDIQAPESSHDTNACPASPLKPEATSYSQENSISIDTGSRRSLHSHQDSSKGVDSQEKPAVEESGIIGQHHGNETPTWMGSQRPWEDAAREGWMHRDGYHPHQYDQSFVGRHIDLGLGSHSQIPPYTHMYSSQDRNRSEEFTPMPLPADQPLYEASQVVLQPRHNHRYGEQWQQSGNAAAHQRSRSMHNLGRPGNDQQHYKSVGDEDSHQHQHQHQLEHGGENKDSGRGSGNASSSPLYYPQPKSPMVVNPVALWESSEEQARRRAWVQQMKQPANYGQESAEPPNVLAGPGTQKAASRLTEEAFAPRVAMDRIDSSQLPPETPWKISHVRQRPGNEDPSGSPHMGIQFKEGVASNSSAREAASRFLQRWNEAVVARKLQPEIGGSMDIGGISHSAIKPEHGTDAIRLETTVSCEAEDSKGERTVYRFTLSSTLDIGRARAAPPSPHPAILPTGSRTVSLKQAQHPQQAAGFSGNADLSDLHGSDTSQSSTVNILKQPSNYKEPSMSRRSSFAQLHPSQANTGRGMRSNSGHADQFAEADARYWRLQRQLIDLEMCQRRMESAEARPADEASSTASQMNGGWHAPYPEKLDLASPPTPAAYKRTSPEISSARRRLGRRPSAFSVADPASLEQQSKPLQDSANHLSIDTTKRSDLTAPSPGVAHLNAAGASAQAKSPAHGAHWPDERLVQRRRRNRGESRSRSRIRGSPRSSAESADYRDVKLAPAASGGMGVSPTSPASSDISHMSSGCGGRISPHTPTRSGPFGFLHKASPHSAVQAAPVAPQLASVGSKKAKKPVFLTSSLSSEEEKDKGGHSSAGRVYKSAIGRTPTPYPHALMSRSGSGNEGDGGNGSSAGVVLAGSKPRKLPSPLTIPAASSEFGTGSFGSLSPASVGTPLTPNGRHKIQPKMSWGDDDEDPLPPDDDRSIDAQWLRIIRGCPPPRAPVRPAGSNIAAPTSDNSSQLVTTRHTVEKARGASEQADYLEASKAAISKVLSEELENKPSSEASSMENADANDRRSQALALLAAAAASATDPIDEAASKPRAMDVDEASTSEDKPPSEESTAMVPAGKAPEPSASLVPSDPPRKLQSTRSFPSLASQDFDTLNDSDIDAGEQELQQQFWSRAMKPKSGSPTRTTPNRRKSIVELSSSIAPKDVEEWMQWKGDGNPGRDGSSKAVQEMDSNEQLMMITPPVSEENTLGGTAS